MKFAIMIIFVSDRVKNIVEKGANAGNQHFSLFSTMFSKDFLHFSWIVC